MWRAEVNVRYLSEAHRGLSRKDLELNLEFTDSFNLDTQQVPGISLSLHPSIEITVVSSCAWLFSM